MPKDCEHYRRVLRYGYIECGQPVEHLGKPALVAEYACDACKEHGEGVAICRRVLRRRLVRRDGGGAADALRGLERLLGREAAEADLVEAVQQGLPEQAAKAAARAVWPGTPDDGRRTTDDNGDGDGGGGGERRTVDG